MKVLLSLVAVLALSGCGKHHTVIVDPSEPVEVSEVVHLQCNETFKIVSDSPYEGNVSVALNDVSPTEYVGETGLHVEYTLFSPECNVTLPTETPVPDEDGKCPEGYKTTDCNTCVVLPCTTCGEGTILDEETNSCIIAPAPENPCGEGTEWDEETSECIAVEIPEPLVCDDNFEEVNGYCLPNRYVPFKGDDCMENYVFRKKLGICKLKLEEAE